ncbi:type VII secretion-associated serine protease mycosin [Micromonospora globbae]|uniref:type VII secretion-associated serine protease mycosin n=1 Tax=Micromonospora globbae TaxID=1894969 RepID=UPI0038681701
MATLLAVATIPPFSSRAADVTAPSLLATRTSIRDDQWHLRYLDVPNAQKISKGDGVIVAVPDTGVDPHPDLRGNLLPGIDVIAGGSGDGREDPNSHGTSMAGLIAAHGVSNNEGALGIAPRAKVLPIRSSTAENFGSPDDLAVGIEYAISKGARVISISSGGSSTSRLIRAIEAALAADIVVVAAAGNAPRQGSIGYPATHPGVLAVGGTDRSGNRVPVSLIGPALDVAAPGADIYSTSYDGKYSKGTGTSSATAIVAGAVALIRSKYPHLPAREVVHRLTATAVDKGPPGRDDEYGYGVIDIVAALTADVPPLGFESATASAPAGDGPSAPAAAPGDEAASDRAATVRGLVTLGVIVAAGVTWTIVVRRRRRDDPPPRISR